MTGSNRRFTNGSQEPSGNNYRSLEMTSGPDLWHRNSGTTNEAIMCFSSDPEENIARDTSRHQIPHLQPSHFPVPQRDPSSAPSRHLPAPAMDHSRCTPLDMHFLWKLYHDRQNFHSNDNNSSDGEQKRIQTLQSQGFPMGLATLLLQHAFNYPFRIWLVDNGGTMHQDDGHIVTLTKDGKVEMVNCSRWEEVSSALRWHAELAAWMQTPMVVRFLRDPGAHAGPQQVGVSASKNYSSNEEVSRLKALLRKIRPTGATSPIQHHLQELVPAIHALLPKLQTESRRLVIYICTDSIPTDMDGMENQRTISAFILTLQQLMEWPVQVVVRLLTDEARVVTFYQILARDMAKLQVLDDYVSECKLVQKYNPWLHYGYPLHLCREQGIHKQCLEALSKRTLTAVESVETLRLIFNHGQPQDQISFAQFFPLVKQWNKDAGLLWNPTKKRFVNWVDMKKFDKYYNEAGNRTPNSNEKCCVM